MICKRAIIGKSGKNALERENLGSNPSLSLPWWCSGLSFFSVGRSYSGSNPDQGVKYALYNLGGEKEN